MLLNAEQIQSAKDRKTAEVDVPEWGKDAKVLIGSMGALDAARFADWLHNRVKRNEPVRQEKEGDEQDRIVTCDSPDEKGETLDGTGPDDQADPDDQTEPGDERTLSLTDHTEFRIRYLAASILDPKTQEPCFTVADVEKLGRRNKEPLSRLFEAALELNIETADTIEDAEKNSGAATRSGSGGG